MSMIDRPAFEAQTRLPGLSYDTIRQVIRARAEEHDLPLLCDGDSEIRVHTTYGTYGFRPDQDASLAQITSEREDWLYVLKESLSHTVSELAPDVGAAIRWSDAAQSAGNLPPNFQFITIEGVTRIPGGFLRVSATAEDLSQFTPEEIHFRLALPPADLADPQWPSLSDTGLTLWPKGAASLHRPVYTVREMDRASGHLVFDIFEHLGGRATEWARSVTPGTKVGLTGPGGGGIPEVADLAIYTDETGLPAVARILEALPLEARIEVLFQMTDPVSLDYALPSHPGARIERRPAGDRDLADQAIADLDGAADRMVWLAAEKQIAQKLRAHFKSSGRSAKDHYIAAYWSRTADSAAEG